MRSLEREFLLPRGVRALLGRSERYGTEAPYSPPRHLGQSFPPPCASRPGPTSLFPGPRHSYQQLAYLLKRKAGEAGIPRIYGMEAPYFPLPSNPPPHLQSTSSRALTITSSNILSASPSVVEASTNASLPTRPDWRSRWRPPFPEFSSLPPPLVSPSLSTPSSRNVFPLKGLPSRTPPAQVTSREFSQRGEVKQKPSFG